MKCKPAIEFLFCGCWSTRKLSQICHSTTFKICYTPRFPSLFWTWGKRQGIIVVNAVETVATFDSAVEKTGITLEMRLASWWMRAICSGLTVCLTVGVTAQALSADKSRTFPDKSQQRQATTTPGMLVVLIGGMDSDPTPAQIRETAARQEGNSGLYRLRGDLTAPRVHTEYFNWNGTRAGDINSQEPPKSQAISELVRQHLRQHPCDRVALIGNSWGGHTACLACQSLYESSAPLAIDLVVFLDPASAGRKEPRPRQLPPNIVRAINFHTRNAVVWRRWEQGPRLLNIDLGDPQQGFLVQNGPAYHSLIDFQAHIAAEWDERVHHRIREELLAELP